MGSNQRILYLDLLRIFATLAVIILHVAATQWYKLSVLSPDWKIVNIFHSSSSWAVPIFIMISGYFFLRDSNQQKNTCKVEYRMIFKKNISRILCSLVFWGFFYGMFFLSSSVYESKFTDLLNIKIDDLILIFKSIIIESPSLAYHLWFLYMIIGLYLLTPFLRVFTNNAKKDHLKYFLYLFFIGASIPFFNNLFPYIPLFSDFHIYFNIPELSGYAGYYIAGYYFATFELNKTKKIAIIILSLFSWISTILLTAYISVKNNEPLSYFTQYILPTSMLISISIFLVFQKYFSKIQLNARINKIIFRISKYTFGIYLIHVFVIQILDKFQFNILFSNFLISIPVMSILVLVISLAIIYIIDKIPVLRKYII